MNLNGGRGIRTPGTVPRTAVFKTAGFNHSPIPPICNSSNEKAEKKAAFGICTAPVIFVSETDERPIQIYAAAAANLIIAGSKMIVAVASGSSAMLSEGIHSLADT